MSGCAEAIVTLDSTALIPPTGSGETVLFDSSVACPGKRQLQGGGFRRIKLDITHNQDGELKIEKSTDRGANWILAEPEIVASAGGAPANEAFDISSYDDFRVLWANGGVDQTIWEPSVSLSIERSGV